MRRAFELAGAGIVLGVLGAVALRQVVASQLYEVSTLDPRVFLLVPLALLGVALRLPACRLCGRPGLIRQSYCGPTEEARD